VTSHEFDVAIIGGGPAGSAAALTLLRYSKLRVVVIERGDYGAPRVGETLSPAAQPLLEYLDVASILEEHGQLRNYGTAAAWGSSDVVSRDFLFVGAGNGWHLDRARFDRALATAVRDRGGTLRTNCMNTDVDAAFVIDASGRHASYARKQGAVIEQHDNLTGLVALFDGTTQNGGTLVEAVPDGWWYSAQLPDEHIVVALMTDADIVRDQRLHERDVWVDALNQTLATRNRLRNAMHVTGKYLRNATMAIPPSAHPAQSQIARPPFGDGWIAAGEAAVAFDPLSSMGIGYALASGIQAARLAAVAVSGNDPQMHLYGEDVASHFAAYLARKRDYYLIEQRWKERPFWARRQREL
jgi:flavin-dependent dehydrogenase